MADATVNIRVTDLEPFARFIGKIVQANDAFCRLSAEEAETLPASAADGLTKLQAALRVLANEPVAPIYEVVTQTQAQTEALRGFGERTLAQMHREQAMRSPRRTG